MTRTVVKYCINPAKPAVNAAGFCIGGISGWPMLDNRLAILNAHPHLYGDIAAICYFIPLKAFYYYLERTVHAGFGKRVMFGWDNMVWPQGTGNINQVPFLTEVQKRDILFNNAARFLRLPDEEIQRMYGNR